MIYLDNNATTMPLPEVVEAMNTVMHTGYANPSSIHQFGQSVRHRVECAREQVARLIGATPREVLFTSGGTESINTAIRGALAERPDKRRFVTTAVEHSAVMRLTEELGDEGYAVEYVSVDREGRLDEAHWAAAISEDTALVSLMAANNETGVMFDVPRLAGVAAERGVPVHVDAVQAVGKLPIDVSTWPVALLSLSAHKFHGPKGVGALFVRRRTRLRPLIVGGSQERDLRGGTENVPGIVGMGVAAEAALRQGGEAAVRVAGLRDALETGVLQREPAARVNGAGAPRVCNTSNISFPGLQAEAILIVLSEAGICASSGSACSSGSLEPSHVLKAMGIEDHIAHGAIRFSLSRFTTREEIDQVLRMLPELLARLTALGRR
ncbi:MAG: aminotransferase class V-fold PLP-dependent enzyme [Planctomycetes bacterium]|nr:aminotransferase class V-fold PLP-dependent enzyme [Planctomycetota bacterium]